MTEAAISVLRNRLGDRLVTSAAQRAHHSHGQDSLPPCLPDAVAFVTSTAEVASVLAIATRYGTPVVPFGAGTSLEGQVTPVQGGIALDLSRMDAVIDVHPEDMDCRVQAGVTREQLNAHLRDQGLFFPVDPGATCTIGGMCATRASGTNAVRYGTIRENVLGLTVAMADGRVVRTGGRVPKSATGYDLTSLFIGSEGMLGVITEVQLRLRGIPEAVSVAICQFGTLSQAVAAAAATMQAGVPVARIELLDELQARACIAYSGLTGLQPTTTLLFEFHGSPAGVVEQSRLVQALAAEHGASTFTWATEPAERTRIWKARHEAYWAAKSLRPGYDSIGTDAIVPISRLVEAITGAREDIDASGLTAPIAGHVGDGNFHCLILYPPGDDAKARAMALDRKIVGRALRLGGSCSGEHGIGLGKAEFLARQHGPDVLDVMRALKAALDPAGILNPGKMFQAADV